jgi:hypothetical protein
MVSASALLLGLLALHDAPSEGRLAGIVLYSARDSNVSTIVRDLKRLGLYATEDRDRFRTRILRGGNVVVLTRSALPMASDNSMGRAYVDGALIVGLDMSLRDLETLIFGSSLRVTTDQEAAAPLLSMLYDRTLAGGCGGHGEFSDRLHNWEPTAEFILHRAREIAVSAEDCH